MGGSRSPEGIILECGFIVEPVMREGTWITEMNECSLPVRGSIMVPSPHYNHLTSAPPVF